MANSNLQTIVEVLSEITIFNRTLDIYVRGGDYTDVDFVPGSESVGKPCGMVVGTADQARVWIKRGFYFLICGEPTVMVRQQTRQRVHAVL